jgi:hypothetical protein
LILLDKLRDYYGKPDTPSPDNFFAMYRSEFAGVPEGIQEAVAMHVIRTQKGWGRPWPTIPEIWAAVKTVKAMRERGVSELPPIEDFESWFAGLRHQVENATSEMQIAAAIEKLSPYVEAQFCLPSRMHELWKVGAARSKALKIKHARNPAGVDG